MNLSSVSRCISLAVCFSCLASCGYTLQTKANLPFETIAIGKIENKTSEPKLQDKLNRILAESFMEYGISISASSRFIVEGDITQFYLRVLAEQSLTASQYEVVIRTNFRIVDSEKGTVISLTDVKSPFMTSFNATQALEDVLVQKDFATDKALLDLSQELVRRLIYKVKK